MGPAAFQIIQQQIVQNWLDVKVFPVVLKIVHALVFHHQKGCSHQSKNHWKILHHFFSQLYCNISHPPVVDTFSYDFFKTWNTATSMGYSAWVELGEWCRFLYKTSLTAERGVKCVHQKRATRFFLNSHSIRNHWTNLLVWHIIHPLSDLPITLVLEYFLRIFIGISL